jgi:nucleoside-diphosphate-sugar epimerase
LQKRRILLIGGAGTLGSDILDANLPEYELFVIDNFSESALAEEELQGKVSYKNMSVGNKSKLLRIFQEFKPQIVLYLATTLSQDQLLAYESNVLGMANTIEVAEKTAKPYIIYIQSFLTRNCDSTITVDSSVEAKDSYATWKLAAEYLLSKYSGSHTTLVLASVLSPRLSVGAIPAFIKRIQNNEQIKLTDTLRDYITCEMFVSALCTLIEKETNNGIEVLGSSKPVPTVEIFNKTASALGVNLDSIIYKIIQPNPSDPKSISLENSFFSISNFESLNIDVSINRVVKKFIDSKKNFRLHHLGD